MSCSLQSYFDGIWRSICEDKDDEQLDTRNQLDLPNTKYPFTKADNIKQCWQEVKVKRLSVVNEEALLTGITLTRKFHAVAAFGAWDKGEADKDMNLVYTAWSRCIKQTCHEPFSLHLSHLHRSKDVFLLLHDINRVVLLVNDDPKKQRREGIHDSKETAQWTRISLRIHSPVFAHFNSISCYLLAWRVKLAAIVVTIVQRCQL